MKKLKHLFTVPFILACVACSSTPVSGVDNYSEPKLVLEKTNNVNRYGNPILEITMFDGKSEVGTVNAVSGRFWTQRNDRHLEGTKAPLPDGEYSINPTIYHVNHNPELGDKFIEIYPKFQTGRTHLGIHLDPSYNTSSLEDGTNGCIGVTTRLGRNELFNFIHRTNTTKLIVKIKQ